jgi:asparagine synthase (glutamine-hydrolysing)
MCGIAGSLNEFPQAEARSAVRGMTAAMRHRGPDDGGSYEDAAAGLCLGHLRLSIIDLSAAGRQPMANEDGNVVLVFNGEIYNFVELREQLVKAGHRFASRTDSEVIVHGYEEWGPEVVSRLCGMFAFAIWDVRQRTLFLARDPMGIKPLYYRRGRAGAFHFASEIKAFLALPDFRPTLNPRTLRQFLELNFITDPHESSLTGVYKLPAGHTLALGAEDLQAKRLPTPRPFFTPPPVEPFTECDQALDERTDRLYAVLDRVVAQHMVADVPVGLLLSGGIDSSIIAALAARHTRLRTISMAFADSRIDERPFARAVSEYIGSQHEEVLIRPGEVAADLERSVWYFDDLFGDWGLISTMLLYRKCRQAGIKVILVGEGSDELFGGYPSYEMAGAPEGNGAKLWRRTLRLYQWYSGRRWGRELWRFAHTIRSLYQEADADLFSAVRLFETRHQLPHHFNMKVDKASMAVSVEARVPFLDVRVASEGYRAPRSLLTRDGTNKYLLRRVAERHRLLPPGITRRPKFGASMAASWIDETPGFRAFARDVILDPHGLTARLGLTSAMRAYFDGGQAGYRFPSGLSIFSVIAWRLLLLNLWARHYLRADRIQAEPMTPRAAPSVAIAGAAAQ